MEPSIYYADYDDYQITGTIAGSQATVSLDTVRLVGADLVLTLLTRWDRRSVGITPEYTLQ